MTEEQEEMLSNLLWALGTSAALTLTGFIVLYLW